MGPDSQPQTRPATDQAAQPGARQEAVLVADQSAEEQRDGAKHQWERTFDAVPDSEPPTTQAEESKGQTDQVGATVSPSQVHSGPTLRVLLVDDHKIVRQGIRAMLAEASDIEVVGEAGNGQEAIELADQLVPDVIVMDMAMPVMAGDEATRHIKQRLPQTRVVALSMFDDTRVADRMRQAGAAAYLLKTAPAEELLAAIRGREPATRKS
jgi:CheY-like chemotaxis protein